VTGVRYWRERDPDQRLTAYECQDCGWVSYPERKRVCKECATAPAAFEEVQLREEGEVRTFVVQERLPEAFETPQPVAIVDLPQEGEGQPARVYGLLTETAKAELSVGATVETRFREVFTEGDRPVHSFKFAVPRSSKGADNGGDPQ
jgi:uncharacterized OB-fold protein